VLIAEIAEKKNIPIKFLESILLQLKQQNILESKKGKVVDTCWQHLQKKPALRRCTGSSRADCHAALREPQLLPEM